MRRQKPIILGCILLLLSAPAGATNTQALAALSQGDYQRAAIIWRDLANDGDLLAQYNLALLYRQGTGVNPDNNLFAYWLAMAARQGLAPAYARLNQKSVIPSSERLIVDIELSPEEWVASQNPRHYTLQLASSTNKKLIQKYYEENKLSGQAGYYRSLREGEEWYALVYGSYGSVHEAKAAIDNLPTDLKKWSPWVRSIRSIHKLMLH